MGAGRTSQSRGALGGRGGAGLHSCRMAPATALLLAAALSVAQGGHDPDDVADD